MPGSEETPDSPSGSPPSPPSYKNSTVNADGNKNKASSPPANLEQSDNDDTTSSNESPPPPTPDNDEGDSTPPPSQNTTPTPSGSFSPPPSNFSNNSVPKPALMPPPSPISPKNHTSPSTENNDKKDNNGKNIYQAAAGAAVAGLFIIALVSLFFCLRRRNKKKRRQRPPYGMPPPPNFQVTTDAYIAMGNSGRNDSNFYYNSQGGQQPHSNMVADFGLARLNDTTQTHVSTRVMGTFGYLAPEYASSGKLTDRSDVFSFGVVLLELITGRKPVDPTQPLGDESLVEWARPLLIEALETGNLGILVDQRLEKRYVESEMFRMIEAAAACVRHSATKRPRMVAVARALDFEGDSSDLSNGVKFGQSTVYDSGQYSQEIMNFRRLALASDNSSEFDYSGEYNSREVAQQRGGQQNNTWNSRYSSGEFTSGELEKQAFKPNTNSDDYSTGASGNYGGGRFRYS
ncbi:hypothetical protein COLO4_24177 [Corchorus olitorius]|uniref:non-specific serine/threonine protein kinase n=1 Tax=Corchorus olitorius TaxID=93759 RepID=A0A1R3ICA2_9ROSI|nr:hypothetical protein COLO4_24177 [Corchorus olitorius]